MELFHTFSRLSDLGDSFWTIYPHGWTIVAMAVGLLGLSGPIHLWLSQASLGAATAVSVMERSHRKIIEVRSSGPFHHNDGKIPFLWWWIDSTISTTILFPCLMVKSCKIPFLVIVKEVIAFCHKNEKKASGTTPRFLRWRGSHETKPKCQRHGAERPGARSWLAGKCLVLPGKIIEDKRIRWTYPLILECFLIR